MIFFINYIVFNCFSVSWVINVFILAVTLSFSITIGKIKQGSLSILELVWGVIVEGGCRRTFFSTGWCPKKVTEIEVTL